MNVPRFGLLFGGTDLSIDEMVKVARQAEARGIDALYCVEAYRSGLMPLAALAYSTASATLGPYVLNATLRTPYAAGLAALDIDEMSGGRLALAVGAGNAHLTRQYAGVESDRPLARVRDYVQILRLMMRAPAGEIVSHEGRVHSINWARSTPGSVGRPAPVYVAGASPKMLAMAVTVADGLALGALTSPGYIRDVIRPPMLKTASHAGRDAAELGLKVCVILAVHDDPMRARESARRTVAGIFASHPHPYYEHLLREQGFGIELERCLVELSAGRPDAAVQAISDDVLDSVTVCGTPSECAARLSDYGGLVDEVVVANASPAAFDGDPARRYALLLDVVEQARTSGALWAS